MLHLSFLPLLRLAVAGTIVAWLTGCASVSPPGSQTSQPTGPGGPQEQATTGSAPPSAVPSAVTQPTDTATPLPAAPAEAGSGAVAPLPPVSGNRAVVALLERARQEAGSGRRESAGASLERALRIEPRNAWLWHELARLRLTQGQYAQAVSLSQKSNSLAVKERTLQALNWHLIADARIAQGDPAGAAQARKLAEDMQRP
ncbi:MAG: tetratricopeptide repeat protein [Hylemonella sp.]|nr:tetratricopeptide repeat protein [Hylemonella sp.]